MSVRIDLTGKRYGSLMVVKIAVDEPGKKKKWLCKCDCGEECVVAGSNLQSGHIKHCRKCGSAISAEKKIKHGMTRTKIYYVWQGMLNRCERPEAKSYKDYGARGIKVCEEWHDPEKFLKWAKESGYREGLQLDRINVNGNYCPDNCRWITQLINANNKRNNMVIEHNGETKTLAEWARYYGVNYKNLSRNLKKGFSFEKAIKHGQAEAQPETPTLFGEE